jgi:hypothetical protein
VVIIFHLSEGVFITDFFPSFDDVILVEGFSVGAEMTSGGRL